MTAIQELQELEERGNIFVEEILPYSQCHVESLKYSVAGC
jgi:hypothetical protein